MGIREVPIHHGTLGTQFVILEHIFIIIPSIVLGLTITILLFFQVLFF